MIISKKNPPENNPRFWFVGEKHPQPVTFTKSTPTQIPSSSRSHGWLAGLWVIGLVGLEMVLALSFNLFNGRERLGLAAPTVQPTQTLGPSPTPIAHLALSFGKKGSGAGYFTDPRTIAVDSQGHIFGEVIDQPIETIAIDGQGRLAWGYSGNLVMTDDNGKLLGQVKIDPLVNIEFNQKGELVGVSKSPSQVQVYSFGQ